MKKIINKKFLIVFILLISFVFVLTCNEVYARSISFNLKDGTISIIKDSIDENDDKEDEIVNPDDEEDKDDEITTPDIEEPDSNSVIKEGVYVISCSGNSNYVLDIYNKSLDWGGNLQICVRNSGANQKFYISQGEDGYYKIMSIGSALTIDVEDGVTDNGANIRQWQDNDSDAQKWKVVKNDDGTYNFIAKCSGKALDVNGAVYEEGTNVQQWDYINSEAQKFNLEETELVNDNEIVSIRKATNYKTVLDIDDNSSENKTKLQLWEDNGTMAQRFEIHKIEGNEIRIRTASSGGWLTEVGTKKGSEVIQLGDSTTSINDANTWIVGWNNGITFRNKESNLFLDVNWDDTGNGTKVQIWEENNDQIAQRFLVNRENLITNGWYEIESRLGTTLDLENSGSDWGTNILTWQRNEQNNQKFNISYTDSGYLIKTMHSLALDVKDGSKEDGADIRQWEDNGAACQRWIPEIRDGGYITLKNVNSGKYMDVENGNSNNGANVIQYSYNNSKSQLWKLKPTTFVSGWFSANGAMYCADPQTGEIVKNCTRVDPTMTDPSQYGSIYDFDSEGRATWHLPTFDDLPGGQHGKTAPIPTPVGDERQRTLLYALSRVGCDYKLFNAPTGFVCDGLIAWSYTNATGKRFRENTAIDDQDMSYQYNYIKARNGIQTDISKAKPGDIIFWGDPAMIGNNSTNGSRHVSIYYYGDYMIHAADVSHGVCIGSFSTDQRAFGDFIGFGSPYEETSKCEINN